MRRLLICLLLAGCRTDYPVVHTTYGSVHTACERAITCKKKIDRECPWGYEVTSQTYKDGLHYVDVVCR
jgi:hypothetical protein